MLMKQITESEWNGTWIEKWYLKGLCQLPYSVQELEDNFNLSFSSYVEDGLGRCYGAFVVIENQMYFLRGFHNKEDKTHSVLVQVKSFEKNLLCLLDRLCQEFRVERSALIWEQSDL